MNRKPIFSILSLLLSMILPTTVMASEVSNGKDLNLSDGPSNMKSGGVNQQTKKVTGTIMESSNNGVKNNLHTSGIIFFNSFSNLL